MPKEVSKQTAPAKESRSVQRGKSEVAAKVSGQPKAPRTAKAPRPPKKKRAGKRPAPKPPRPNERPSTPAPNVAEQSQPPPSEPTAVASVEPPGPSVAPPPRDPAAEFSEVEVTQVVPRPDDSFPAAKPASPDDPRAWLIDTCRRELAAEPNSARAARLHYEIARLSVDAAQSQQHFRHALAANPAHLASVQALRRLLLIQRDVEGASELFDAEIRFSEDNRTKARLYHDKGRAIEDLAGDRERARACYVKATQLDQTVPAYFKALEHSQHDAQSWSDLVVACEGHADAVRDDSRHRAAIIAGRARLLETRLGDRKRATELYEHALDIDPHVASAQHALKRLLYEQDRWRELAIVLEREAEQTTDPSIRTQALFCIGRIHSERLGSRVEATDALARAMQSSPTDRLVLDTVARIYEAVGEYRHLANVLAYTVDTIAEPMEQLGVLHRIGSLYEKRLGDDEQAQRWYDAALQIDPSYAPAVAALDGLYERSQSWEALIVMHLGASEATSDSARRAAAHARIATIFETRVGQPEEAMRHHAQALSLESSLETSFKALVRLYTLHERHRELIELYERGIDHSTEDDVVIAYLFKIGALYEDRLGDAGQAAHAYKRILSIEPTHLGALHARQRATERACRYGELAEALELESNLTDNAARKAALLQRAGDVLAGDVGDREAAVLCMKRVLALDATYAPALTGLGKLYHALGRHSELRGIYERELEIISNTTAQTSLLYKLGELCEHQLGNDDDAIAYYRRAIEVDPTHGPALRSLAFQLRRREDYEGLVGVIEAELRGNQQPEVIAGNAFRLGEVHEVHLKQYDKAVSAYERALAALPDHRPSIDALARVRTRLKHWTKQAEELMVEAHRVGDQHIAIDALMRAGEIYAELLDDPDQAVAAYEGVRHFERDNVAMLLALEQLYRRAGAWEQLADVYALQAGVLGDARARVAALEELARIYERHGIGGAGELRRTYSAILSVDGTHLGALRGLEYHALLNADLPLLADIDARYARAYTDHGVIAAYQTRLGESLEVGTPQAALSAYRTALEHDAENIAAIRGLGRAAERCDDALAMIEACRREASWTRVGEIAADVLVKSAQVRIGSLSDPDGAIEDAERALERWPDHADAARTLSDLLREAGEIDRLVTLLSRAAGAAAQAGRVSSLWRVVARLYAYEKDDIGAALACLDRLMEMHPDDASTLRLMGDLYVLNRQWNEAKDVYQRSIELKPPDEHLSRIYMALGRVFAEHLDDRAAAISSLRAVLAIDSRDRDALLLLLQLHNAGGDHDAARLTVQRLLKLASDASERAWALLRLGRIELAADRRGPAAEALRLAVAITGSQGEAAAEYKKLLGEAEPWGQYVEVLQEHIRRVRQGELRNNELRQVYLEIARIQHEVLLRIDDSIESLRAGLDCFADALDIHHELAARLGQAGRTSQAVDEYRRIVQRDPASVRAWRGMARAYHRASQKFEAGVALAPLVILGEATDLEAGMSRQRRVHSGFAQPASFDTAVLQRLSVGDRWEELRIATLFEAIGEALIKMYPVDFDSYGVSARDRLRAEHPLRVVSDRLASIFAVEEYDLFIHGGRTADVVAELADRPALMVPQFVVDMPDEQQVFMLARAFVMLSRNMHAVVTLGWREIAKVVAAALRTVHPDYGNGRYPEQELESIGKRLHKALSRRNRRLLETAAAQCLAESPIDVERWGPTVARTSARAAALLTNDLPSVIAALHRTGGAGTSAEGAALVRGSTVVADLFRFWPSDVALEVRRAAGII